MRRALTVLPQRPQSFPLYSFGGSLRTLGFEFGGVPVNKWNHFHQLFFFLRIMYAAVCPSTWKSVDDIGVFLQDTPFKRAAGHPVISNPISRSWRNGAYMILKKKKELVKNVFHFH